MTNHHYNQLSSPDQLSQHVSPSRLQELRGMVAAAQRVKTAAANLDHAVHKELQDLELNTASGKNGLVEHRINVLGYTPFRYEVTFVDNTGESVTQSVVMFAKRNNNGQWTWLPAKDDPKNALALDADLYDSRLRDVAYRSYYGFDTTFMPSVNGQGEYIGVCILDEDPQISGAGSPGQGGVSRGLQLGVSDRQVS